ncbi:hypothetical protein JHK85_031678 [Glycine max]|nr:hypothetical protein JHK85_031678 [Glycine max]KAG4994298.1 hypothetical protein JHK86_031125 [Glycine max]
MNPAQIVYPPSFTVAVEAWPSNKPPPSELGPYRRICLITWRHGASCKLVKALNFVVILNVISTFYSIPKHMDTDVIGDLVDKLKVIQNDDGDDDKKSWASFRECIAKVPEQILPQLLYYFGVDNEVGSLDWASIVVYACEASCEASLPYKDEFAWIQIYSPSTTL